MMNNQCDLWFESKYLAVIRAVIILIMNEGISGYVCDYLQQPLGGTIPIKVKSNTVQ